MPLTIGVIGIGVEPQKGPNRGLRTMTRAALKRGWGAGEGGPSGEVTLGKNPSFGEGRRQNLERTG